MYGFEIRNRWNQKIVYGEEQAYLFWGKMDIAKWNEGDHVQNLFNIPVSWQPLVFVRILDQLRGTILSTNIFEAVNVNGRLHGKIRIRKGTSINSLPMMLKVRVYVFVPAVHVPLPSWGMALYNTKGVLAFHTKTKPLQVQADVLAAGGTSLNYDFAAVTIPASLEFIAFNANTMSGGSWLFMCAGALKSSRKMGYFTDGSIYPSNEDSDIKFPTRTIVINANDYDGVWNLPPVK